jgi:hypothetical protein
MITVYAPDGKVGRPPVRLAATPPSFGGLRIGVLDNGKPNARLLMTRAAEQLAKRTGAQLTRVTDKGPGANAATPCTPEILEQLAKEVDLIFTGSAD